MINSSTFVEVNLTRTRAEKWNSDQSRVDRTVRELRAQVDDLTEALSAKDGQLAVLKVRLDEADQLLKARSSALEQAQNERVRWVSLTIHGSRREHLLFSCKSSLIWINQPLLLLLMC